VKRKAPGYAGTMAPPHLHQLGAGIRLAAKRTVVGAIYSTGRSKTMIDGHAGEGRAVRAKSAS
jgi:hypothetical protein